MTDEEFKKMLGEKPVDHATQPAPTILEDLGIPSSIDWRSKGAVNKVQD